VATDLTRDELHRLARLGALRRLEELRQEEAAIRAAFPDLAKAGRGRAGKRGAALAAEAPARRRRRRKMSPAEKKAVSERMKKYWAERRKAR
jgi:hypothetical protein